MLLARVQHDRRSHWFMDMLTPFARARQSIGWTIPHVADLIGCDARTARRWDAGEYDAPPGLVAWLERVAEFVADNPAPARAAHTPL